MCALNQLHRAASVVAAFSISVRSIPPVKKSNPAHHNAASTITGRCTYPDQPPAMSEDDHDPSPLGNYIVVPRVQKPGTGPDPGEGPGTVTRRLPEILVKNRMNLV